MSFIETPRFPDRIAFTAMSGPAFSTNVITLVSGFESRNINWSETRHTFDLAIPVRTQTEVEEITAFFRRVYGRANGFRIKDWSDYDVVKASCVSLGNSPDVEYQMRKDYVSGSTTVYRTITKPVSGSVSVYVNDSLQTGGYSVDYTTGIITFDSPPSGSPPVVTWSGEFDVPVRFDTDTLKWRVVDRGADGLLYQVDALPLVEVRV